MNMSNHKKGRPPPAGGGGRMQQFFKICVKDFKQWGRPFGLSHYFCSVQVVGHASMRDNGVTLGSVTYYRKI